LKITGWLFDAYTLGDRMVFWIITEQGKAVRLEDPWTLSFYIAANNKQDFNAIIQNKDFARFVKSYEVVSKQETIFDHAKSNVLKVTLLDSRKAASLAQTMWMLGDYGQYRMYNVDLLPVQSYFFEHDLFPLAFCKVEPSKGRLKWDLEDDVWKADYPLPKFKSIHVEIHPWKTGRIPTYEDRIESIQIKHEHDVILIKHEAESDIITEFGTRVSEIDPDFIFTTKGDSYAFPYLIQRAEVNKIDLYLGREKAKLTLPSYQGNTYSQYGKIFYKPAKIELLGRIHLDSENSFVFRETGMLGFYEIARVCRMPLHIAFRASIGKCLTSLQCYHATKDDILIPWHPDVAEHPKTLEDLLIADRGGLYLVPKLGVHERVAEFDFAALFPNIMYKLNVSAETVRCDCCPDSKNMVPELGYHICEKRRGITPKSLEIVIKKRATYKILKKLAKDDESREIYDDRQTNYKWIGVTSFGYQGYSNAKNGLIDSHQVVCADARDALFKAKSTAERQSFTVVDGIVDSLFVKKTGAKNDDYLQLKDAIEKETGFEISYEGEYKWIAFLPSKKKDWLPVPNRYFGVFEDGKVKVRGMALRRHDTPPLFAKCQTEILGIMARGNTIQEVKDLMSEVTQIFQDYVQLLKGRGVDLADLVITKQLSKDSDAFEQRNTVEKGAIDLLSEAGRPLKAGQVLQYIVTDYDRQKGKRSIPIDLADENTAYDVKWYVQKLTEVVNSMTEPFGYRLSDSLNATL
jgi:DNA polymerase, archaea type